MTTAPMTATEVAAVGAELGFVKPKVCRRCGTKGYVTARVVYAGAPGGCFACGGHGVVEGDAATIAAAKAAADAYTAIRRTTTDALVAAGVPWVKACDVTYAIDHLMENAPARYEAAMASFAAGHPGLTRALWAYAAEHGFVRYGATPVTVDAALAMMDAA